jgi:MFS family permease
MKPKVVLPIIVFSQFLGTSAWFAGNAIIRDIADVYGLAPGSASTILSSVQFGFISGTLVYAFLNISDRFSPRLVFMMSALLVSLSNAALLFTPSRLESLLVLRFATGFFLAGVYPVGMKIASGWYREGLGNALGLLVGALVLGSGLPYLISSLGGGLSWKIVIASVSATAAMAGVLMYVFVPDGPYLSKGSSFDPKAIAHMFGEKGFRASAFGYFGHMWELYAFWAFAPFVISYSCKGISDTSIAFWTFLIFASGSLGCVFAGRVSMRYGSSRVARMFLAGSGLACLLSPLIFSAPAWLVLPFFLLWGFLVVGDSAQFSTLNAQRAPRNYVGSALTIINSIGFAITIVSIQLLGGLSDTITPSYLLLPLVVGPLMGLFSMRNEKKLKLV